MNPIVSVIIPTYNRRGKVEKAIQSALSQSASGLEVLVIDDGSTDGTPTTLRAAFGDRIRYFAQENRGVSAARNKGIAESRGKWIAFLDSDDFWEPDKIEWQLKAVEHFGPECGACYTDTRFFNYRETRTMFQLAEESYHHEGVIGINPDALRVLLSPGGAGMVVCTCSFLGRADLVKRSGGFNPSLRVGEDSEFMFRIGMLTKYCYVNRPLVWVDRSPQEIRHTGVSSAWNERELWLHDMQFRLEGLGRQGDALPSDLRTIIRKQLAAVHSGWANWHLERGQYSEARAAASRAAKLNPSRNILLKWLLTWTTPRLALRAVRQYQQREKELVPFV